MKTPIAFYVFRAVMAAIPFLILLAAALAGAELPPDAAKAIASYEASVKEAEAKLAKAKAEAAKICDGKLFAALKAATQKGDLDAAMAIKAKREEIAPPGLLDEKKEPETASLRWRVIGEWTMKMGTWTSTWTLEPNGSARTNQNDTGAWRIDDEGKRVVVTWSTGGVESMDMPDDGAKTTTGKSLSGAVCQFTRMSAPRRGR